MFTREKIERYVRDGAEVLLRGQGVYSDGEAAELLVLAKDGAAFILCKREQEPSFHVIGFHSAPEAVKRAKNMCEGGFECD